MKQFFKYISLIAVVAAFASCKPDAEPGFSDKEAFVSFDKAAITVNEDKGTVSIPVTLASVKGISTTISYEVIDGTAKNGTNYELADGSATLSFDAEHRTQNILVNIKNIPEIFTGDLKFTVAFKSTGDVVAGSENKCVVTIADLDHPLTFLFNTYTASKDPYFSGRPSDFEIYIEKDAKDVSKVWIGNLDPYFAANGYVAPSNNYFYGIVNEDKTQIIVPKEQEVGYSNVVLVGFTDPDADGAIADVIIEIKDGGKTLVIPNAMGVCMADDFSSGWYNLYLGPIEFSKK